MSFYLPKSENEQKSRFVTCTRTLNYAFKYTYYNTFPSIYIFSVILFFNSSQIYKILLKLNKV
jgi:hypothetical protein